MLKLTSDFMGSRFTRDNALEFSNIQIFSPKGIDCLYN